MTLQQQKAANPDHSVWVGASAGSGKTKVLTDRVLMLLLGGTPPARILCLTYTKAAAAEMGNRIHEVLSHWATIPQEQLEVVLERLLGRRCVEREYAKARQLFAQVVDAPEGVRMMTIHSLCQSLLRRFSLEAQVNAYFRVAEEYEAQELIEQAKKQLFQLTVHTESESRLAQIFNRLAAEMAESSLEKLFKEIVQHRSKFQALFAAKGRGIEEYEAELRARLNVPHPVPSKAMLVAEIFDYQPQQRDQLQEAMGVLLSSSKPTSQKVGGGLAAWLASTQDVEAAEEYCSCLLRASDHQPLAKLATADVKEALEPFMDALHEEQQRCAELRERWHAIVSYQATCDMLNIAQILLEFYRDLKARKGVLDYEDLLEDTVNLLEKQDVAPWVLFKIDGGIHHLLVDEAQDTSAVQWRIIEAIANEFFAGESAKKMGRTLFVVGDEKQSIYSFQGADPAIFSAMKQHFACKIQAAEQAYEAVNLSLSFRSTQAVLEVVDGVFQRDEVRRGVVFSEDDVQHQAYRNAPGCVELWPLMAAPEEEDRAAWSIPDAKKPSQSPERLCAREIAVKIQQWLHEKRQLISTNRCVRPSDIIILVRRRGRFVDSLVAELRACDIAVAGADRLELSSHIAVQDMLACAQFLLLPEDDLTLASLLKSPLIGVTEEQLFTLCYGRGKQSVWTRMQASEDAAVQRATAWLSALLSKVDYNTPFQLFCELLDAQGGRAKFHCRLGIEVDDPLNELLQMALCYESQQTTSLQGFLDWFSRTETTIKRDMEQVNDEVRIMTVHGSKGLQAPIIIVADTTKLGQDSDTLLWDDGQVLWAHDSSRQPAAVRELKENRKKIADEEYRRLLYVALTRARDELYITGWQKHQSVPAGCWYQLVKHAMESLADSVSFTREQEVLEALRYETSGELETPKDVSNSVNSSLASEGAMVLPAWYDQPAPDEPMPPKPLMPSKPEGALPASDKVEHDRKNVERGIVIHQLLELLPEMPPHQRAKAARLIIGRSSLSLAEDEQEAMLSPLLALLESPEYAPIFSEESRAEVPFSAVIEVNAEMRPVTGRIDRLLVQHDRVMIVDYKTSLHIPASPAQIPTYYQRQMQHYILAMQQIYPDKVVSASILWVAGPVMMPVLLPNVQAT